MDERKTESWFTARTLSTNFIGYNVLILIKRKEEKRWN